MSRELNFATSVSSLGRVDDIQNQGPHLALTGLIEVADVSGLGSRRSGTDLADAIRVRARCAARPRVNGLCVCLAHLCRVRSVLSPLSPLFFSFLLFFHQHGKKATSDFWTVLVDLLVGLLVPFPTVARVF